MPEYLLTVFFVVFAAYRVSRAIAEDTISVPMRARLFRWAFTETAGGPRPKHKLGEWAYGLLSCSHCIGFWITLALWLVCVGFPRESIDVVSMIGAAGMQSFLVSVSYGRS